MLIERIVMRTQASRLPGDRRPGRTLDARPGARRPRRELTGGWPAVRLDEPRETRQFEQVRVERSASARRAAPGSPPAASWPRRHPRRRRSPAPQPSRLGPPPRRPARAAGPVRPAAAPAARPVDDVLPAAAARRARRAPAAARRAAALPAGLARGPRAAGTPDAPLAWQPTAGPAAPRRGGAAGTTRAGPGPRGRGRTTERPQPDAADPHRGPRRLPRRDARGPPAPAAAPHRRPPAPASSPGTGNRLAEILAENGVSPGTGGRRRRRYRDDDEPDDVLSRVLGRD